MWMWDDMLNRIPAFDYPFYYVEQIENYKDRCGQISVASKMFIIK